MRRTQPHATRDSRFERWIERHAALVATLKFFRGIGLTATALIVIGSVSYGIVRGDHLASVVDALRGVRDMAANTAGFRIASIGFTGQKHVNREEILSRAGITGTTSLLFFDVADARTRLMADPRIADATLLKLYPDRLQITITERKPYALWQLDGRVSVIADDGSVLEPYVSQPFRDLPLMVGKGAGKRAEAFLALMNNYPDLRANVRAYILIAERRWNLRLKNGLDIKLPEADVASALDRLGTLDHEKQIMTRDIAAIDLREPDRVVVRMSEAMTQAREAAAKEKAKTAKKGGNV